MNRARVNAVRLLAVAAVLVPAAAVYVLVTRTLGSVDRRGAGVIHATIDAPLVHRTLPITMVTPAGGGQGRPLLVFLHGKGGNPNSELGNSLFAALQGAGTEAPDIVFPDGTDDSYWHGRASGSWGAYVLDEVIPYAVKRLGANIHRVAIGGISMGGFGAYDIARLRPQAFCAVGGHSAAMWPAAADTAPGAFDNATDFKNNDVIAYAQKNPHLYGTAQLWLDGGSEDPFHAADLELAKALKIPLHVWPGGHDSAYWNAHFGSYMQFYATALARRGCNSRDA